MQIKIGAEQMLAAAAAAIFLGENSGSTLEPCRGLLLVLHFGID